MKSSVGADSEEFPPERGLRGSRNFLNDPVPGFDFVGFVDRVAVDLGLEEGTTLDAVAAKPSLAAERRGFLSLVDALDKLRNPRGRPKEPAARMGFRVFLSSVLGAWPGILVIYEKKMNLV